MFLLIGSMHIVESVIALKHGTSVLFGKGIIKIPVSPWFTLVFGGVLFGFGIAGVWKLYKDKDKYPF